MTIRIEELSKHSYRRPVLDRLSLEVRTGELLALVGAPGSGRSGLLRVIAGLDQADSGRVLLDGTDLGRLPPRRRYVGTVFQHDPLFGHATVAEAVMATVSPDPNAPPAGAAAVAGRVAHLLDLVGLAADAGASPSGLPPQKRHRLSIARALAPAPRVLLVGQAAPGLDFGHRRPPRRWLRHLHDRLGLTSIVIAHDPEEAAAIGSRIAVLNEGRLEQSGRPSDLQRSPATPLVAGLFGGAVPPQPDAADGFDLAFPPPGAFPADPFAPIPFPPDPFPAAALEVVDVGEGSPARVVGSRVDGLELRVELRMIADGRHVEAEMPGLPMATLLPPGTVVGVRARARPS